MKIQISASFEKREDLATLFPYSCRVIFNWSWVRAAYFPVPFLITTKNLFQWNFGRFHINGVQKSELQEYIHWKISFYYALFHSQQIITQKGPQYYYQLKIDCIPPSPLTPKLISSVLQILKQNMKLQILEENKKVLSIEFFK